MSVILLLLLLVPIVVLAQSIQSGPIASPQGQQCQQQLLAASKHVNLVTQRRDRDEQTLAELLVRIDALQQELEGLKKHASKTPDPS